MKNQQFVSNPRRAVVTPPPRQEPARPGSFKDRQNKRKEEQAKKPAESLADRRKGRKQVLGDDNELGNDLNRLKELHGGSLLDAIEEEDLPEDLELDDDKPSPQKRMFDSQVNGMGDVLEPDQNLSQVMALNQSKQEPVMEEWV